jgi:hypothetical protein
MPNGISGFYNFSIDDLGRYSVSLIPDGVGRDLGIFRNNFATSNSLGANELLLGIVAPADAAEASVFTSITGSTVIVDMRGAASGRPTGTLEVNTIQELDRLMRVPGNAVQVAVIFDVASGHPARAIYLRSSVFPLPPA